MHYFPRVYNFLLIYPAVGRCKIGPVELIVSSKLEDIVYKQAAEGLVKIIRCRAYYQDETIVTSEEELVFASYNVFDWKPVKELS